MNLKYIKCITHITKGRRDSGDALKLGNKYHKGIISIEEKVFANSSHISQRYIK